eukprot:TRINITY_DN9448_c0_g1_i2.p1 TRINITY_DN9448_c0_g1~~TRINITY_DN9448_c0_g1_i2.p1  ORF type:complete len:254 (+),score=105.85 TRINITY_DN9448_c0_g1_i2:64-825(+)
MPGVKRTRSPAASPAAAPAEAPGAEDGGDFELDLGNLMLSDKVAPEYGSLTDTALQRLARDRAQAVVAGLFALPTKRVETADGGGRLALLPAPEAVIPREKPPPKDKPLTKWEEFRKERGLKKRKKEGKIFDETSQKWLPTHGAKRRRVEREHDWVREVPLDYQPLEEGGDAFLDDRIRRRERVQKQKKQQMANIKRASEEQRSKSLASTSGKLATASMGKFDMGGGSVKGLKKHTPKSQTKNKKSMQRRRGK